MGWESNATLSGACVFSGKNQIQNIMLNKTYHGFIDEARATVELNQPAENQILVNDYWYNVRQDHNGKTYFVDRNSKICYFRIDQAHGNVAQDNASDYLPTSNFAPAIDDNLSFDNSTPSLDSDSCDSSPSFDGFGGGDFGGGGSSDSW